MSNSITEIGDGAFKRISSLETVTFPEKLTYIGAEAFSQTALTEVNIPDSVEYIGENAFFGTDIKSVELPSKELYIGENSFGSCDKLESVVFPAGYTMHSDSDEQFAWGRSLSDIYLSDGITNDAAESIIRSLKKEPSSYYNVHFPDSTEISDELISEFPEYITAVGNGSCPAIIKLAEAMNSVEFTDDHVPDIYVTRNTLYLNSDKYTENVEMEIYDTGTHFQTNLTVHQVDCNTDLYFRLAKMFFRKQYPDLEVSRIGSYDNPDRILASLEHVYRKTDYIYPREWHWTERVPVVYDETTKDTVKYLEENDMVSIYCSEVPKNSDKISTVILGSNVTKIERNALKNYYKMKRIFIPRSVTYIEEGAIYEYHTILFTTPDDKGYIEQFAEQNDFTVKYVDNAEEMNIT